MSRPRGDVRLAVMMLDGLEIADRTHVVALGSAPRASRSRGLWEGSTENPTLARTLLADLVDAALTASKRSCLSSMTAIIFSHDTDLAPAVELIARLRGPAAVETVAWNGYGFQSRLRPVTGVHHHAVSELVFDRLRLRSTTPTRANARPRCSIQTDPLPAGQPSLLLLDEGSALTSRASRFNDENLGASVFLWIAGAGVVEEGSSVADKLPSQHGIRHVSLSARPPPRIATSRASTRPNAPPRR